FFPGICTPSDIERALELDCTTLKFFPAGAAGGPKMLKALEAPYKHRGVRFVPTGGITLENMAEFLRIPSVIAIGGSWIVDKELLRTKRWGDVTELTRGAVAAAMAARV